MTEEEEESDEDKEEEKLEKGIKEIAEECRKLGQGQSYIQALTGMKKASESVKVSNEHEIPAQVLASIDNWMASREQAVMGIGKASESVKVFNEHETLA
jgi:hypothetical protein